jgi:hypothetical protein
VVRDWRRRGRPVCLRRPDNTRRRGCSRRERRRTRRRRCLDQDERGSARRPCATSSPSKRCGFIYCRSLYFHLSTLPEHSRHLPLPFDSRKVSDSFPFVLFSPSLSFSSPTPKAGSDLKYRNPGLDADFVVVSPTRAVVPIPDLPDSPRRAPGEGNIDSMCESWECVSMPDGTDDDEHDDGNYGHRRDRASTPKVKVTYADVTRALN